MQQNHAMVTQSKEASAVITHGMKELQKTTVAVVVSEESQTFSIRS